MVTASKLEAWAEAVDAFRAVTERGSPASWHLREIREVVREIRQMALDTSRAEVRKL